MAKKKKVKKTVKKDKPLAYRGTRGGGINKVVGTRVPKEVMEKLEARGVNVNKAIREFLTTLAG